jgi:hypothetical protein
LERASVPDDLDIEAGVDADGVDIIRHDVPFLPRLLGSW